MTSPTRTPPDAAAPAGGARPGIRAILTPGWLAVIGLALAFAAACWLVLAPWQFSRNAERQAQNAQIETALAAPSVPVDVLLHNDVQPDPSSTWSTATATGTFLTDEQVYVRLRQASGQDAREVVLPFRLTDGTLLLVDRGYLLNTDLVAGRLPADPPGGVVTITGRVSADQPDPSQRPDQQIDGRHEVYGIDSTALLGGSTRSLRGFVALTADSPGVLIPLGVPNRDAGPFLSYALQWLVFGLVAVLAAGVFAWREVTTPYPDRAAPTAPEVPREHDDGQPPRTPDVAPTTRQRFDRSELYDR